MKKSAILDIFHGFKGHIESMHIKKEDNQVLAIVDDLYEQLKAKLSAEMLELVDKFVDALENSWADEVDFYFKEGVKLGVNLGMECVE